MIASCRLAALPLLLIGLAVIAALALSACSNGESAVRGPAATPTGSPAATAPQVPEPTGASGEEETSEPERPATPIPTAAPSPTATPEPWPQRMEGFPYAGQLEIEVHWRLQEAYQAFSNSEQECIEIEFDEGHLRELLETPVVSVLNLDILDQAAIYNCLKRQTAADLFLAALLGYGLTVGDTEVPEEGLQCIKASMALIDTRAIVAADLPDASPDQKARGEAAAEAFSRETASCMERHGLLAENKEDAGPPPPEDALLWEFSTGEQLRDSSDFLMLASAVTQGTVYAASGWGQVYALDAKTGQVRWHVDLGAQLSPPPVVAGPAVFLEGIDQYYVLDTTTGNPLPEAGTEGGQIQSAKLKDGTVYVSTVSAEGRTTLRAFDSGTGEMLWESDPRTWEIDVLIFPLTVHGDHTYVSDGPRVHSLASETGSQVWTFSASNIVPVPPTVSDGVVYIQSYERVHAVDESTGRLLWESQEEYGNVWGKPPYIVEDVWPLVSAGRLRALDAVTGMLLWPFEEDHVNWISGVADGMVLVQGRESFYALDATTGQEKWSRDSSWKLPQVTVADGVIYANAVTGDLHTLDLQSGEPLWTQRIGYYLAPEYGLYRVVDGVVYATHREGVRAYRAPSP